MDKDKDKKTVLVVEDDPLSMRLTTDLLELNGFNTLRFTDGFSALDALKNIVPDLILLDISLPGMNGFEVYKKMRGNNRLDGVKIIAFSASAMKEDEEKIKEAGFSSFIPKPIEIKSFVDKIRAFCQME